ncbi:MAG TPA: hypothetical protein VNM69_20170 [Bacillus sp. (in: firmicutes)]|uniref:hypothetical protein n=1 Tax=Bacillus litorisediminis TaxID=2922713 RepID=UPI001FAB4262|nr:hypothetical protein [Bacillus litorisediminis]HWO78189.1 hypothetical protein [Bacillus sp. (in: firmicutes)]
MLKRTIPLPSFPRENVLEVKIFALPDQTPQHYIYERCLHPYLMTFTPKVQTNSHYQRFLITEAHTFEAIIKEGRTTKTALVHIYPAQQIIEVEERFGLLPVTNGDIYDIISCFSFKVGKQTIELILPPDRSQVFQRRKPFILIQCLKPDPIVSTL